jgi:acyl phosphate:glycerol-3-phosphate acyltransferase
VLVTCIVVGIVSYLLGSFPTAYLVVRRKAKLDIRREGSGNVGAMNAFEVTGNSSLGFSIMCIDLLKGVIALAGTQLLTNGDWLIQTIALLSVVLGHSFSVWIRFRGGRGLATAAGALFCVGWSFILVWGAAWGILYLIRKDILVGNIAALIIAPAVMLLLPQAIIESTLVGSFTAAGYILTTSFLDILLLITHWKPIKELLLSKGLSQ